MNQCRIGKIAQNYGISDPLARAKLEGIVREVDSYDVAGQVKSKCVEEILHIASLHEPKGYEAFWAINDAIMQASKTRSINQIGSGIFKLHDEEVIISRTMKLTLKGLQTRIQDYILGMDHTPSGKIGLRRFVSEEISPWQENAIRALEEC